MNERKNFEGVEILGRKITLPGREEMLQKLIAVDSNVIVQEKFYPYLLQGAGKEMGPKGCVVMFRIALSEFEKKFSSQERAVLQAETPFFIDALVGDKEFADWVKQHLESNF